MAWPGPPPPRPWRRRLDQLTTPALDLLYPPRCPVCRGSLGTPGPSGLCTECHDELPSIEQGRCQTCGEAFDGAVSHPFECWNCENRDFAFDYATAGYRAEGAVRELIHRFKYDRHLELRGVMGRLLLQALKDPRLEVEHLAEWTLVPVPLFLTRRIRREYNQSWELCRELSRLTGIRAAHWLSRVRRTRPQASLNRGQRLDNLRRAFALDRRLRRQSTPVSHGARVLLVDDVFTTGATTHECARVLRQRGGVEKVVVITVGRG